MRRPRLICTLAFGASVLALATGAASGQRTSPYLGRVGLASHTIYLSAAESYAYLLRARQGGIRWIREDFSWGALEPGPNRFDWQLSDALMRSASRLGINVLALATYAPDWASGATGDGKFPPLDPHAYAVFVRAVALRYGARGTFWRRHPKLRPRPLRSIEIWNEPWDFLFWRPEPDPAAYAALVRAGAEAIKSVHPEIQVLASADIFQSRGDSTESIDWFDPLLKADPALWRSRLVDAWSVHLYSQSRGPLDAVTPQRWRFDRVLLTRQLAAAAGASKPIWITEFGWGTDPGNADDVSEETQAQYEHDAIVRAVVQWGSFVTRSFVFDWTKPTPGDGYNLIRDDGSAKPAWYAITQLIRTGG